MSETINVEHAFDPEARQAQADMDAYLATRPYEDKAGGKHHPETGEFIDIDDESLTTGNAHTDKNYFELAREKHYEDSMPTAYEDMSMPDLARALANAEHIADTTKAGDIQDVLIEKMDDFAKKNNLDTDAQENLFNRIMKVKDGESEKLGGSEKVEEVEEADEARLEEVRNKIYEIKRGMAERAAKGLDSPDYDVAFEEAQDNEVVRLLAEGHGVDVDDPRVLADLKELDEYEEKFTDYIKNGGEAPDPEIEAGKILQSIAESRFNNEASELSEQKAFLEFLDILKNKFGTDDLEDPRIQEMFEKASQRIEANTVHLEASVVESDGEGDDNVRPLHEDLAHIPDAHESGDDVDHRAELEHINKQHEATPNIGFRLKLEYVTRLVQDGVDVDKAMTMMLDASNDNIDEITAAQMKKLGVDNPTDEQRAIVRQKIIDNLRARLEQHAPKPQEEGETRVVDSAEMKQNSWREKIRNTSLRIGVLAKGMGRRIAEYFSDPERGNRRKVVAAGAGIAAVFVATKYGLSSAEAVTNTEAVALTDAEKLVQKNPENFQKMIQWFEVQQATSGLSDKEIAEGFVRYLSSAGR